MKAHILLALAWILFCVLHSVLASGKFKRWVQAFNGKLLKAYRVWYTIFALLGFAAIIIFQVSITSPYLFLPGLATRITGMLVALPGILIMLSAIYKYFLRLSGMYWLLHNDTKNVLQRSGIHQYIRHPLYLGTFLFIWGLLIFSPTLALLIANIIITIYTLYGIRFEEEKLVVEFGIEYKKYQQEVPMIIPKINL